MECNENVYENPMTDRIALYKLQKITIPHYCKLSTDSWTVGGLFTRHDSLDVSQETKVTTAHLEELFPKLRGQSMEITFIILLVVGNCALLGIIVYLYKASCTCAIKKADLKE